MRDPAFTQPWILRWHAGSGLRLRLSVDERHHLGQPIRREHDLPRLAAGGRNLTDQHAMRRGLVMTVSRHLAALKARHPGEEAVGYAGNGNLLANFDYVAWRDGRLYHLAEEPVYRRVYPAIVARRDGSVGIEEVAFARENGGTVVLCSAGTGPQDATAEVEFVTSGVPVVREGRPVPLHEIAERCYDTRCLVRPLCLRVNGSVLYLPNSQLQEGLIRKAVAGPVHVRLESRIDEETCLPLSPSRWLELAESHPRSLEPAAAFLRAHGVIERAGRIQEPRTLVGTARAAERLLDAALKEGGYRLVDGSGPLRDGEARFLNGHLEIFLRKAVYPHHFFAVWEDGSSGFVVFPGKSGRSGVTLAAAQAFLAGELGARDALLIDSGGDARLWAFGRLLVPPGERRPQIRSLVAVTAPRGETLLPCLEVRRTA